MVTNEKMRAVIARGYGGTGVLEVIRTPIPRPGPGQLLIRVEAATVNPVDVATRTGALVAAGLMSARTTTGLGWDVAGTVAELGPQTTGFTVEQPVIGLRDLLDTALGAYAEYIVLDANAVAPAPRGVAATAAATLPLNALTAAQSLDLLALTPGSTVLITGAAGAVGGFAVELAARRGLRVAAHAGNTDAPFLRGIGAEWFVDRDTTDLAAHLRRLVPGGVDGALDTAGLGISALAAVRTRGAFAGVTGGQPLIPLRGIGIHQQWISADGAALADLTTRDLTLRVAGTLPLDRAAEAHGLLEKGGLRGRLVLTP
ncbi:NADP-dependent oxidoreductase [Nocardia sp. NPDC001965]